MYCTKCGNVIPEESLVCGYCGQPVEEPEEQSASEQQPDERAEPAPSPVEVAPSQEEAIFPDDSAEQTPEEPQEPMVDISSRSTEQMEAPRQEPETAESQPEEPPVPLTSAAAPPPVPHAAPVSPTEETHHPAAPERRARPVAAMPLDKRARPVKTAGFFFTELLLLVPVINIILLFVWAFRKKANLNRKAFARSILIWILIGLLALLAALIAILVLQIPTDVNYWIDQLKSAVNSIPKIG